MRKIKPLYIENQNTDPQTRQTNVQIASRHLSHNGCLIKEAYAWAMSRRLFISLSRENGEAEGG
jgi:hypothetical protein